MNVFLRTAARSYLTENRSFALQRRLGTFRRERSIRGYQSHPTLSISDAARTDAVKPFKQVTIGSCLSMSYREQNLETLSKGNQQKIQLIASLLTKPKIVILDEPFSGLDPVNVMMMREIVSDIVKEGRIVMLSGHQMPFIEQVCQNIAILDEGVIDLAGDLAKIKQTYPRNTIEIRLKKMVTGYLLNEPLRSCAILWLQKVFYLKRLPYKMAVAYL